VKSGKLLQFDVLTHFGLYALSVAWGLYIATKPVSSWVEIALAMLTTAAWAHSLEGAITDSIDSKTPSR
jgi:hypothetical protein